MLRGRIWGNTFRAIILALLCVSGVLFFSPLDIIIHNPNNFTSSFGDSFIFYGTGASAYLAIVSFVFFILLLAEKSRDRVIALLFSIGLLFWIQGNLLSWNYGLLDGRDIDWNEYLYRDIIDVIVWAGIIFISQRYRSYILKNLVILCSSIIFIQVIVVGFDYISSPFFGLKKAESKINLTIINKIVKNK